MLIVCLDCNSKLFWAGGRQPSCEACGSTRLAIISGPALFGRARAVRPGAGERARLSSASSGRRIPGGHVDGS